jgi:Fe-S cluster assembly protein SufD
MSSALNKPKYKMIIDNYYNQIANKEESLTSLNTAFAIEGVYINIPKANRSVEIMYFSTEVKRLWCSQGT